MVDVISSDFLYRTMDSICNTAAKLNHVSAEVDKPKTLVVRSEFFLGGPTTGHTTIAVPMSASVTIGAIALAVVLAVAGGLLAGSFGGWRAARLRPAAALARVG